jgi:lipoyl(octanoyl) transferase
MRVENWGLISYAEASARQLELVEAVATSRVEDTLVMCSHPPVVTLGRGTLPGDLFGWAGETLETSRGGRATYHGPSQIVAYPILNLDRDRPAHAQIQKRDLHSYLRVLEGAIVRTLGEFGVASEARAIKLGPDQPSLTGVWVGERKIASIGIAVKKWVTYHGLALNVMADPLAFSGIHPCGFRSEIMTSLEECLPPTAQKFDRARVETALQSILIHSLGV